MLMHFRIKHFDRFVGLFIIFALVLIIVTLVFVGREQKWFEKRYHYTVVFNRVQGLKPGTPVTISGMEVGTVKTLRLTSDSRVVLTLDVLETYHTYIRRDSQATILSALLGGKTVEITVGSPNQPPLPEGGVIASVEPRELTDILKDVDLKEPLKKVNDALDNVKTITQKLGSPEGELFTLLKNVQFVTAQLKNGEGNVGAILQDRRIYEEIRASVQSIRASAANLEETTQNAARVSRDLPRLVAEVDRSVKEVPRILEDVKQSTAELPGIMGSVEKAAGDVPAITGMVKEITRDVKGITGDLQKANIPELLAATQESVEEAEKVIRGLQKSWLLRGFMPKVAAEPPVATDQRESPYGQRGSP